MSSDRSRRAQRIVDEILDRAPPERSAFLDEVCAGDDALRREVETLLAAEEAATEVRGSDHPDVEPRRIGPYRLLGQIGSGGMGVVYEAEQENPVRRKVALKLIKLGMDTKDVIGRFDSERQALALMNHPNIANVFDAGVSGGGRPYFAMEFVRGIPITEYCDKHQLSIAERLHLFIDVCAGVQHAHQKGVIHRDLKPSNVLVTVESGAPVPKIIDFGVAKATSRRLTDRSVHTELGQIIGTPEYMSPEQAEMTNLDIDTRTDVYSLGVLFYELLAGARPFDSESFRGAGFDEMRRRVREEDPPAPSARLKTLGDTIAGIAKNRRAQPETLRRELRGDLDWITMKALEKDRTRRYETANAFALDIERYLAEEPIRARPPSAAYRAAKFLKRHKLTVAGAASVILALVVGLVLAGLGLRRAREAERLAARESQAAREVADFLVGMFQVSDPFEGRGEVPLREVLDEGARKIQTTLGGEPEVQARLMDTMGVVYTNLGMYREAEGLLSTALESRERLLGRDHPDSLASLDHLADVLWYLNRLDEAEPLYLELVEKRTRVLGEEHRDTLSTRYDLASLYVIQDRFEEGEKLSQQNLTLQRKILGEQHPDTLSTMHNLASLYFRQKRYEEAERVGRDVLLARQRVFGAEHPETLLTMYNLATVYERLGKTNEAERLLEEVLNLRRRVLDETHPQTANTVRALARIHVAQGRFQEAEQELMTCYRGLLAEHGSRHPSTRQVVQALVDLYEAWGKTDQAEGYRSRLSEN